MTITSRITSLASRTLRATARAALRLADRLDARARHRGAHADAEPLDDFDSAPPWGAVEVPVEHVDPGELRERDHAPEADAPHGGAHQDPDITPVAESDVRPTVGRTYGLIDAQLAQTELDAEEAEERLAEAFPSPDALLLVPPAPEAPADNDEEPAPHPRRSRRRRTTPEAAPAPAVVLPEPELAAAVRVLRGLDTPWSEIARVFRELHAPQSPTRDDPGSAPAEPALIVVAPTMTLTPAPFPPLARRATTLPRELEIELCFRRLAERSTGAEDSRPRLLALGFSETEIESRLDELVAERAETLKRECARRGLSLP
ncbi:MAG: hypothetical protein KIT84_00600 [Labilithrix sp.]|nr:hypothetical protein [Labilithrix sp.]MCW5809483.1 hypothetical protein [Labilithrix sp.]